MNYLKNRPKPQVIICGNDILALGTIYAAQSLGLRVPDDLAVTGIGDFEVSEEVEPAITTVRIPANTIGTLGGSSLVQLITSPQTAMKNRCCRVELVARATC